MSIDKEGNVYDIDNLIEKLAALEHEQWAHWTRYMLDNLTPENIQRWRRQIETPYEDLSEKEKESDRVWARKVMELTGRIEMIEKIYKNKYMATCDNCGTGQECDSWAEAIDFMIEEGWKTKLVDGEWKHYCLECQEG